MKKEKANADLINLNSKIFEEISIEELEERLELVVWLGDDGCNDFNSESFTVNDTAI